MKTTWKVGTREIHADLDRMIFDSNVPWRQSERDALWSIPAIRGIDWSTPNSVTVFPASPAEKEIATNAVLAVVKIHEERVCAT